MIKTLTKSMIAIAAVSAFSIASASTENEMIDKAQEKLNTTFSNWTASHFGKSPIDGLFEVHSGNKIIYYHPESEIMIFGKMFNAAGEDLSQKSLSLQAKEKVKNLPMDSAINIQSGKIKLIEIVNPDCGYCKKYDQWAKEVSKIYSIERNIVFLDTPNFPAATAKIKSVICAKDKAKAYSDLEKNKFKSDADCKTLQKTMQDHALITETLGINGTPTFIKEDGSMIIGYNPAELEAYFIEMTKEI